MMQKYSNNSMRIVLIGKNGQLGWEFQHILPSLGEVISLGQEELDITDVGAVQKTLLELQPNLIINASAYTKVDLAEMQVELAANINAIAPGVMAETARKLNAVFIHYSTDYVFDGKNNTPYLETDPTNPLNVYGKSKLMGEENIKQAGDAYLILRTSWVYSLRGNSFVNKVLEWSRKNKTLRIVIDQISCPTWARALAEITSKTIVNNTTDVLNAIRERSGIYHLAGSGYTSRYEWAKLILANDPKRTEQLAQTIEPVPSEEFPTPAARPLFSALNCKKFAKTFGLRLPNWEESLRAALTK
jgi:dTDP-4-dehydrorhamnose reductase